jgi:histidyl-tRNA synthetase
MDHNPMRVFDCKVESCRRLNEAAPKTLDCLCRECDEHFGKVRSQLSGLNVPFEVNGFLVRGIDYYQRTTVEFASEDLGAQSALGGGGRYDSLFQQLGAKQPVPSMGYAGGVERLLLSLEAASFWKNRERGRSLFICHMGEQARGQTLALALKWRKLGWDVHYIYSDRALKAQLKQADRLRCRYCLFLGDRELEAGKAPLKRLADGHQVDVSLSSDEWLKELTRT